MWPYYVYAVAIASLITSLYFKDKLQLKLFILFLGFGAFTTLFVYGLLFLWLYITLMVVWFIGYFVINILISKKRSNNG